MKLKISRTLELEINGKLVEKKIQEVEVYKNEGKRKYQRTVRTINAYYYPKDKNGIPDLNGKNRIWDKWDSNFDNLKERFPLFGDFIFRNRIKANFESYAAKRV